LWGWTESEVYKRNVDTPDELLVHILDAAGSIRKREDQRRPTTRDLRKELQSAGRWTVGFTNIYSELQQICYFRLTNFLLKH